MKLYPPALLQRLVDDSPSSKHDTYSPPDSNQMRRIVINEIRLLMEHDNDESNYTLPGYDYVANSVINYGINANYGINSTTLTFEKLANNIRKALLRFEPRLIPEYLNVRLGEIISDSRIDSNGVLNVEISGLIAWDPQPIELCIRGRYDKKNSSIEISRDDIIN